MRKKIFLLSLLSILFMACSKDDADDESNNGNNESGNVEIPTDFDTNTQDITVENAVKINFAGNDSVDITNPYQDGVDVTVDALNNVVITSTIANTQLNYVLSGQTSSGSVKIYSDYKFGLVLNGVSIISTDRPAINIQSGKKASITVVAQTNNRLVDGTTYSESSTEDMKAALYSEGQLVFSGAGTLQVIGRTKHGICSDDYIHIDEASISINTLSKDGIHANDYIEIEGGNLSIKSANDAIECEQGYITINGGTINIESTNGDGIKTSYASTDLDRNINISGGDLTIQVSGEATKGIKSKGDINLTGGTLDITTTGSAYYDTDDADISSSAGIKADGNMTLSGNSALTINSTGAGGKGININGTLTFDGGTTAVVTSGDRYIYDKNNDTAAKAIKSDGNLTVNSGTIKIKTSKTEAEGLESKSTIIITGGVIEVEAYDDCINASNHIDISGGTVYCLSETNDAIDSNGTLTISGGTVIAIGSSSPECGFDCDNNTFNITGGTIVGLGGSTSKPTSSSSTQRSLVYGSSAYETIHIESAGGEDVLTFKLPKTFNQTTLLFSTPAFTSGSQYTLYTGGTITGGTSEYGLYSGAIYNKGTSSQTFTTTSMVTSLGNTNNGNMGGGGRPSK